ncbi:Hypothetical protein FKW44_000157 [Caligus rogercresseyi]|uniref:Uncharacterized protein n=1 Tax=Caligus rogercresseyi TaxID=217165 RepID=A0A7T8KGX2_CALRO|nr:Hypothetical protein FKW44_000157 [Caligus rogercresseyi]
MNLESFQDTSNWKDLMMVMALKLPWLHMGHNITIRASSSTTTPNYREHQGAFRFE